MDIVFVNPPNEIAKIILSRITIRNLGWE
jgi:hypothetical protein